MVFVVAASTNWDAEYDYDCPAGLRVATTQEGRIIFAGESTIDMRGLDSNGRRELLEASYAGQCGWSGLKYAGQERVKFRFSDSRRTGAYKHAQSAEVGELVLGDFGTSQFAGIVCIGASDRSNPEPAPMVSPRGRELWRTNGTAAGTSRVSSTEGLASGGDPGWLVSSRHPRANWVVYAANSPSRGRELWRSDGT